MVLDFCACHPDGKISYYASDIILLSDTDSAYLVLPGATSRIAGYYFLAQHPPEYGVPTPTINGSIHVECKGLKHVIVSAVESETGGLFTNRQIIIPIRHTFVVLGHPQPPTPLKTDNSTSYSFVDKHEAKDI